MLSKGLSLPSRAGPCARGQTGPCPPGARLEGASPPPSLLFHYPVCARHVHSWALTHTVYMTVVPTHAAAPSPQHLRQHTHPHIHTHVHHSHCIRALPVHIHTHSCTHATSLLPCVHPHLYVPTCSHPSQTSNYSHLGHRHTPTGSHPHSDTLLYTVHAPAWPWSPVPF